MSSVRERPGPFGSAGLSLVRSFNALRRARATSALPGGVPALCSRDEQNRADFALRFRSVDAPVAAWLSDGRGASNVQPLLLVRRMADAHGRVQPAAVAAISS